jgi:hypothetical protein
MDISDELTFSTVRMEVPLPAGASVGTAFFYHALEKDGRGIPVLVTNKHVIEGGSHANFVVHLADANGGPAGTTKVVDVNLTTSVVRHPDAEVDLCAILIADVLSDLQRAGEPVFYSSVSKSLFPTGDASLRPLEDIIMIGYPSGLWDSRNNLPIARRGVTATSPARNYEDRPEFMIDAACFPGSSGSPVFLYERSAVRPRPDVVIGRRFFFLGVLYAGPVLDNFGCVQRTAIPSTYLSGTGSTMMHLGFVIHATQLLSIEDVLQQMVSAAKAVAVPDPSVPARKQ